MMMMKIILLCQHMGTDFSCCTFVMISHDMAECIPAALSRSARTLDISTVSHQEVKSIIIGLQWQIYVLCFSICSVVLCMLRTGCLPVHNLHSGRLEPQLYLQCLFIYCIFYC